MVKRVLQWLILPLGVLAVFFAWHSQRKARSHGVERIGYQDADRPLAMQDLGVLDGSMQSLSAWDLLRVPLATRFDFPMGTPLAGLVYDAQPFFEMNAKRGGPHLGEDWNGIGGQNTDLGDPVYAVADGLVVYAGEPSSGWGNVVLVEHRTSDGRYLQSMYAHLDQIHVMTGRVIARGQVLGTVGTAHGNYLAHLHFEMRETRNLDHGPGYSAHPMNRLNPSQTIATMRGAGADDLAISMLQIVQKHGSRELENGKKE